MKLLKMYILLVISLVIQTTFLHRFSVLNVFPNIVLVLVFIFALTQNSYHSVVFAFVSGLFLDLIICKIIGLNSILLTYIALLINMFSKKLFYSNSKSLFLLTLAFTIIYQMIFYVLNYTIWQIGNIQSAFNVIFIEAIYNSIIAVLIYKFIVKKYIIKNN